MMPAAAAAAAASSSRVDTRKAGTGGRRERDDGIAAEQYSSNTICCPPQPRRLLPGETQRSRRHPLASHRRLACVCIHVPTRTESGTALECRQIKHAPRCISVRYDVQCCRKPISCPHRIYNVSRQRGWQIQLHPSRLLHVEFRILLKMPSSHKQAEIFKSRDQTALETNSLVSVSTVYWSRLTLLVVNDAFVILQACQKIASAK